MNLPLEITFRHMEASPALEARVRELASRLERFSQHIMRCHVVIEAPHQHGDQGALFDIRLGISIPDHEISVQRTHRSDPSHKDPYKAVSDAFHAARRQLEDYERKRRQDVKAHSQPTP